VEVEAEEAVPRLMVSDVVAAVARGAVDAGCLLSVGRENRKAGLEVDQIEISKVDVMAEN
jgi:hypothetical protein